MSARPAAGERSRNGDGRQGASTPPEDGDDVGRAAEELAARVAGWVARTAARAREEAEDIWAEAQDVRRNM